MTETRSLTAPDSAQTGTVMGADTLKRVPTGRSYQSAAGPGAAAVNRRRQPQHPRRARDPQPLPDRRPGHHRSGDRHLLGQPELRVHRLGAGADRRHGGAVQLARRGDQRDQPRAGRTSFTPTPPSTPTTTSCRPRRETSGSNLYNDRQPFNSSEVGPNQSYQVGVNVGGPILQNRLWYNATYELRLRETSPLKGAAAGRPALQHPAPVRDQPGAADARQADLRAQQLPPAEPVDRRADPAFFNNVRACQHQPPGVAERSPESGRLLRHRPLGLVHLPGAGLQPAGRVQVNTIEYGPQGRLGNIDRTGCDKFSRMATAPRIPTAPST